MAASRKKNIQVLSAEEKIKEAARRLFTQKGFSAVRTRDIAEEAGINLALLNYYFRSKQALFDLIMTENLRRFIQGVSVKVIGEKATIDQKIERLVAAYIDFLTENPSLPLFILNELQNNPSAIVQVINDEVKPLRQHLFQELGVAPGKEPVMEPFHFIANMIGLTLFPFVGRPILQRITHTSDKRFRELMEERKKMIPVWIKAILRTSQQASKR